MARILLADDDVALRTLVHKALSGDGHHVIAVDDGLDALATLSSQAFDLVVSDLDMPGLDGMGLAAKITSGTTPGAASTKILLISGLADELQRASGFPPERVATLQKPFTLDQLREKVRAMLRA
ncbi:MAG TPA: response regulator [Hyphomicrobiaceae bacterium]|nr:response regulator [Hyphomicrobiaceae bacterium]